MAAARILPSFEQSGHDWQRSAEARWSAWRDRTAALGWQASRMTFARSRRLWVTGTRLKRRRGTRGERSVARVPLFANEKLRAGGFPRAAAQERPVDTEGRRGTGVDP